MYSQARQLLIATCAMSLLVAEFSIGSTPGRLLGSVSAHGQGLTFEEHISSTPPAPANVAIKSHGDRPRLVWSKPTFPPGQTKFAYDPAVTAYRVYRVGADLSRRRIAETSRLWFDLPRKAGSGIAVQNYAVTTVTRSGHESPCHRS